MWPHTEPKEDFERVPKNDTVNMRTERRVPPPPGGGEGGQAFELYWGSAAEGTKHKGNQY